VWLIVNVVIGLHLTHTHTLTSAEAESKESDIRTNVASTAEGMRCAAAGELRTMGVGGALLANEEALELAACELVSLPADDEMLLELARS
jgi:hypothetical protein